MHEGLLVIALIEQLLVNHEVRRVVVAEELGVVAMLVSENAVRAVHAVVLAIEHATILGLQLVVVHGCSNELGTFGVSMGEGARFTVLADATLDPAHAQSRLVLLLGADLAAIGVHAAVERAVLAHSWLANRRVRYILHGLCTLHFEGVRL